MLKPNMKRALRVDAAALSPGARVESHYPVRVCVGAFGFDAARSEAALRFEVVGAALGFVPVVICGLASHEDAAEPGGLWLRVR